MLSKNNIIIVLLSVVVLFQIIGMYRQPETGASAEEVRYLLEKQTLQFHQLTEEIKQNEAIETIRKNDSIMGVHALRDSLRFAVFGHL